LEGVPFARESRARSWPCRTRRYVLQTWAVSPAGAARGIRCAAMVEAPSSLQPADDVPLRYRIPNALTVARLAVLPLFWIVLFGAPGGQSLAAAVLFAVASLTDWFDGFLARRFHHSTRFGRLADPLADRLLIDSAVLILWWHDRLALAAAIAIFVRDAVLLLGLRAAASRGYELSVIYLGKTATAVLMVGLDLIMLTSPSTHWSVYVFYVGLGLSLLAGVIYVVSVRGRMRAEARGKSTA
jgi:CDP-diacylglycerol--glycerol-3-phosphate 3-phosphatidyltransferase